MASNLAPIDESVKIPEAVRRAAAIAESHYAKAGAAPAAPVQVDTAAQPQVPAVAPSDQPIQITVQPAPEGPVEPRPLLQPLPSVVLESQSVAPPVAPAAPAAPTAPAEPTAEEWKNRDHSMQGRFNQSQQTLGGMQEQISELSQELARMTSVHQQPRTQPVRLITPDDEKTYGPELIDLARRAGQEALQPTLTAMQERNRIRDQNEARRAARDVHTALDQSVPDWRVTNESQEFLSWLRLPDIYSGMIRGQLLRNAFASGDAPRVTSFFKNYLAEAQATGQIPAPQQQPAAPQAPRIAAVPLVNLAAPGAMRPATDLGQQPVDKPIFTHRQVAQFYSHEGRQRYVGREADRVNDEKEIFAAQAEGRIR